MGRDRNLKFKRSIAKSIIENSFTVSAWVFTTFIQLGEITMNAFLSPSLYAELPSASFEFFNEQSKNKNKPKEMTIRQSIHRLQKLGFVIKIDNKYVFSKTGKKLAEYILNRKKVIDKKWDKKYRVVIFDIPEKMRRVRDWLRQELNLLNYRKLQESVFISKYPMTKDLIQEIKKRKIGNCVNYLLVDKVYKNIF